MDGKPVGKAMNESKSILLHRFQPPIDKPTDNDIEKDIKRILKNTIQYKPDDRPTMKQVVEQLSQLKKQIVRIGDFEVIMTEDDEKEDDTVCFSQHVATQQPVIAERHKAERQHHGWIACLENEGHILQNVITPHENIMRIYHSSKKEYEEDGREMEDIWLIKEYFDTNLNIYANEHELTVKQKLDVMIQVGRAICHLHEQRPSSVVHRNIQPDSLVVSGHPDAPVIKLFSFYVATTVDKDDFPFSMQSNVFNSGLSAPELTPKDEDENFTELMYDISVDVFALGISCLMLLEALKGSDMTEPKGEYNIGSLLYILSSSRTSVQVKLGLFNAKIRNENRRYIHRLIYQLNEQDLLCYSI